MRETPSATLPSCPSFTEDCEQDILRALDRKRKELDEEIAQFRAKKDLEYKEFEAGLRNKRKVNYISRDHSQQIDTLAQTNGSPISIPSRSLSPNSDLNAAKSDNGRNEHPEVFEENGLAKKNAAALSLPSPSPSPSNSSSTSSQSGKKVKSMAGSITPPVYERDRDFHGLFTPTYLTLLDVKQSSLPKQTSAGHFRHLPESSRLSPDDLKHNTSSPTTKRNSLSIYRDKTVSPTIKPSTSLPSALRRTSSDGRPKSPKHVTFQLSDLTVVDPSSSYEELPTPEIPPTERDIAMEMKTGDLGSMPLKTSAQQHSIPKRTTISAGGATTQHLEDEEEEEDDDDVFALDEDLEDGESIPHTSRGQKPSDDEILDLDSENAPYTKDELQFGSPSAGSLPISIMRPSPRGLEGGMYGGSRG